MSRVVVVVGLVCVFVVSLLLGTPARLINSFLPSGQIIMQGYSGTLWKGEATRALVAVSTGYVHLGKLQWSLDPLSLLTLAPKIQIESRWGKQQLSTGLRIKGRESFELTALEALFSAQLVRQFVPVMVVGDIVVAFDHLEVEHGVPSSGDGRIVWQGAGWETAQGIMPLGSYAVDMNQLPGQALLGEILTISGAVRASGNASLQGKKYSVDVLVASDAGLDSQLEQALSLIAQPVSEGYRVTFNGQLQ